MKRTTLLLSSLSFLSHFGFSQAVPPRVQIVNAETKLAPFYSASTSPTPKTDSVLITLLLNGTYDTANPANNSVGLLINNGTISNSPVFLNGNNTMTLDIPVTHWPTTATAVEKIYKIEIKNPGRTDRIANDEVGYISINGHPNNYHVIRYSNSAIPLNTNYNPTKSFWIEVGANFDLVDGLEPNNFFSGVFFHKRDIRPWKRNSSNNIGVFAGIYESKTATSELEDDYSIRSYYDSTSFSSSDPSKMDIYTGVGNYVTKRVVRNVGLFFSPQVRITNLSANDDGLHS